MEGWDEILDPDLPKDIVIQSWRGQKSLAEAARHGFSSILSAGYYLDHMEPASTLYAVDPLDGDAASLPDEEKARILGGEVAMWGEFVSRGECGLAHLAARGRGCRAALVAPRSKRTCRRCIGDWMP